MLTLSDLGIDKQELEYAKTYKRVEDRDTRPICPDKKWVNDLLIKCAARLGFKYEEEE